MYCGSCMHDNALARELGSRGHECLLLPVYTPIRTDATDFSAGPIFFGGVNVYLQQKWPWLGRLPGPLLRLLDRPGFLRFATRRAGGTDPALLGDLTVSMLKGTHGHQATEARRLIDWLRDDFRPDLIVLTNLLIGGCIPELKEEIGAKIMVWLQGDDIFLDHLPDGSRREATELMGELAQQVDGCLVNSEFYAAKMGLRLGVGRERFEVLPLAIDTTPFDVVVSGLREGEPREAGLPEMGPPELGQTGEDRKVVKLGYFARLAPEKGFHNLVEAFIELSRRPGMERVELHYGGWLGEQHRGYVDAQVELMRRAGLEGRFHHHGSPSLDEKLALLRSLDLFCVPTDYEECKGLYVLEALAAGVPVVQPEHGAFPELLASTGGGRLYPAGDRAALVGSLESLLLEGASRKQLGAAAIERVRAKHAMASQAERLLALATELGGQNGS